MNSVFTKKIKCAAILIAVVGILVLAMGCSKTESAPKAPVASAPAAVQEKPAAVSEKKVEVTAEKESAPVEEKKAEPAKVAETAPKANIVASAAKAVAEIAPKAKEAVATKAEAVAEFAPKAKEAIVAKAEAVANAVEESLQKKVIEIEETKAVTKTVNVFNSTLEFCVEKGKVTVKYPAAVTDEEVIDFIKVLDGKYDTTGLDIYKVSDGVVCITYPDEYAIEDVVPYIDVFVSELINYINELFIEDNAAAAKSVEEKVVAEATEEAKTTKTAEITETNESAETAAVPAQSEEVKATDTVPANNARKTNVMVSADVDFTIPSSYGFHTCSVGLGMAVEGIAGKPVLVEVNAGTYAHPIKGWKYVLKNPIGELFKFNTYDSGWFAEALVGTYITKNKFTFSFAAGPRFVIGPKGIPVEKGHDASAFGDGYVWDFCLKAQAGVRYQMFEHLGFALKGFMTYMFESKLAQFGAKASIIFKY